jgi:hypothetical protein
MDGEETIFSSLIFSRYILPFLLVFTLIFAILEKTKILGEDKRQINAIISLVMGLIVIIFPYPTGIIVKLVPFLAVAVVIILVFMILWGFVAGGKEGLTINKGLKITFGIIIGIAVIVAVAWATGAWEVISGVFTGGASNTILLNLFFIAIVVGAIAAVVASSAKGKTHPSQ